MNCFFWPFPLLPRVPRIDSVQNRLTERALPVKTNINVWFIRECLNRKWLWFIGKARNNNNKALCSGQNQPPGHRETSRCSQWPVRAWSLAWKCLKAADITATKANSICLWTAKELSWKQVYMQSSRGWAWPRLLKRLFWPFIIQIGGVQHKEGRVLTLKPKLRINRGNEMVTSRSIRHNYFSKKKKQRKSKPFQLCLL